MLTSAQAMKRRVGVAAPWAQYADDVVMEGPIQRAVLVEPYPFRKPNEPKAERQPKQEGQTGEIAQREAERDAAENISDRSHMDRAGFLFS
jgi:hypothetical protein